MDLKTSTAAVDAEFRVGFAVVAASEKNAKIGMCQLTLNPELICR